jgi:cyanophycinase
MIFLYGGGRDESAFRDLYDPFLAALPPTPTVAFVVVDETSEGLDRWIAAVGAPTSVPVLIRPGDVLDVSALKDADAVFVGGGLTPAYADAIGPVAADLRAWLDGRVYAGFSAGAAVAASPALVGGWRSHGVEVCAEECAEDLDELTVREGLGLVPGAVEVHAAQWGNLTRLMAAVRDGFVPRGIALDENTGIAVDGTTATVIGRGHAHVVTAGVTVVSHRHGGSFATV